MQQTNQQKINENNVENTQKNVENTQKVENSTNKPPVKKYDLLGVHLDVWSNEKDGREYESYTLSEVHKLDTGEYKTQKITLNSAKLIALKLVVDKAVKEMIGSKE